jgi:predicted unusual protein kinase regulating ubiquinone biosynthesis (AarF/ABC1/UbiB family)
VTPELQEKLLRLLLAAGQGRGEEVAAIAETIGEKLDGFQAPRLAAVIAPLVAANQGATLQQLAMGRLVLEISRAGADAGLRLPSELTLRGKTLLHLDEIGRCLDPEFDPNAAIRRHAAEVTTERLRSSASSINLLASLHEAKDFVEKLPARSAKILDLVANNELRLRVDAIDEQLLMEGFQKVANRIATGLVLAALIVGAAMLMNVSTDFRILGYPGLAIVCFLAAAGGGVGLIVNILWNDRKKTGRPAPR